MEAEALLAELVEVCEDMNALHNQFEEAEEFKASVEEALHIKCEEHVEACVGTTVGCHTGPFPLGFAFLKKYDA